jgi:succinoglycan biosynthesis protein ExoO
MAAFNAKQFIERAMDSALTQVGVDLEVIVVDDASTDDTISVVSSFAERDDRVRLIRLEKNAGPSAARNAGLSAATGSWVAVLDCDDKFRDGRLQALVSLGEQHGADIVADNFVYFDPHAGTESKPALRVKPPIEHLSFSRYVAGARPYAGDADFGLLKPIFRTDFLRQHKIFYPQTIRHGEDFELIVQALEAGARYFLSRAHAFYVYTGRSSGWSRTTIDYRGQIDRARDMAGRPDISAQLELARAFLARAESLDRLQGERLHDQKRAEAGLIEGFWMDVSSPSRWRSIARDRLRRLRLLK